MRHWPIFLLLVPALAGCLTGEADPSYDLDCAWGEGPAGHCVTIASHNESPAKAEVDIAVDPDDPSRVFVASKDLDPLASTCVWSVGQVTHDAGQTWETVYVGGTLDDRADPTHPLYQWDCITDPILQWTDDGLYYALQAYELLSGTNDPLVPGTFSDGSAFYLAKSTDDGKTFPEIVPMAIADGNVVFHDYPRMAWNPETGAIGTVWNALSPSVEPAVNLVYVATTQGDGGTLAPPATVLNPTAPTSTLFASGYTVGSDETWYMTVAAFSIEDVGGGVSAFDTGYEVLLTKSTDDGRSWGVPTPMFDVVGIPGGVENTEFRAFTANELAIDRTDGEFADRLYMVWADVATGNSDVLAAWSDDQGATWSDPVTVGGGDHDQFMSRVVVDTHGTIHTVYFDRQYDADNTLLDITWAWSQDGGETWEHRRVTRDSFDGDLGIHQGGQPFIGDYLGIATSGDHVWMGFPVTHTGVAEIGVAHVVRS